MQAGTGKSTIVKLITHFYNNDPQLVGQLENKAQETFGLAKVAYSSLVVAPDVDSKFTLDPTAVCSMASGEFPDRCRSPPPPPGFAPTVRAVSCTSSCPSPPGS